MSYSLQARALLIASIVLAIFLIATGIILDQAFRDSAEAALRESLRGYAETLEMRVENDHLEGLKNLPQTLGERLIQPNSGLYATLFRLPQNEPVWVSESAKNITIPWPSFTEFWTAQIEPIPLSDGAPLYVFSMYVEYRPPKRRPIRYLLQIGEVLDEKQSYYYSRIIHVRYALWRWFGGAALFLLALQVLILRKSFSPLRQVVRDLHRIETGQTERLQGNYPQELHKLTQNLNALLDQADARLTRYRNALGDLAHSLKTPLAVLRGTLESTMMKSDTQVRESIERMNYLIEYHLKRAAAAGYNSPLAPAINVLDKVQEVVSALNKVYAEKNIVCHVQIESGLLFRGDEGDLLEILGNLIENAYKWAHTQVRLSAQRSEQGPIEIHIEDDGPGISPEVISRLLKRGERADPATPGHGLGLAIVSSILQTYGGTLHIHKSALGGALLLVQDLGTTHSSS